MTLPTYEPHPIVDVTVNVLTIIALVALAVFVVLEWRRRR